MQSDITKARAFTKSDTKISGTVVLDNPTGNEVALTLNYTTNKLTSGNDTGLLVNMTDTASPGTSLLQDWQVGGSSKAYITSGGLLNAQNLTAANYIAGPRVISFTTRLDINDNVNPSTSITSIGLAKGTFGGSGVTQIAVEIVPTINQATTSSMTALLINRNETALGSGEQLFVSMSTTALGVLTKFRNDGVWFPRQAPTASAPTYTLGGIYFDTTLNKLRVGGVAGWETITSA